VQDSPRGDDWIGVSDRPLALGAAAEWVVLPSCGAVVVFSGTVRDHADGRPGVSSLEYEAYEEQAEARMAQVAEEARRRWPALGRVVVWHRVGLLQVTEPAVIVAVSSPHRADAFEAARWAIDTVKESVPIWKHETWAGGEGWGADAHPIADIAVAADATVAGAAGS
jgi:molybdopterin synthase catalytic subunit